MLGIKDRHICSRDLSNSTSGSTVVNKLGHGCSDLPVLHRRRLLFARFTSKVLTIDRFCLEPFQLSVVWRLSGLKPDLR